MVVYHRETTFQQRRHLFEVAEQTKNISEACRQAKVSRSTYYRWKPGYEKDGVEGLREPKSHAAHNPHTIDPQIEKRIVELRREHPNWGKKRIAQWIWKEHDWEKVVAIETVRKVLLRHGLWNVKKREKKRKNEGTTADKPNKTVNIDLCFIPEKEMYKLDFSHFFQQMDWLCKNASGNEENRNDKSKNDGLSIFSQENLSYDEKIDAYVLMRKNKEDKQDNSKDIDIEEIEKNADVKQEEGELRWWRRKIRINRSKEDAEWKKYREKRVKLNKEWKDMSKEEKNEFKWKKEKNDAGWKIKKDEMKKSMDKRSEEDKKWRNKRKEIKERMNIPITSLVAVLVIIDNCTRKCLGLPVFIKGRSVTADDVIKALDEVLPPELRYIISDNGKQFIAEAFQELCTSKGIVHARITPHRPATNGIAERFVERLKEMLAEREWKDVEELIAVLKVVIAEYNDVPHQGLDGLSPNECERRLMCTASGWL